MNSHLNIYILFAILLISSSDAFTQKKDSVMVPASTKYVNESPLRTLFIGKNYRKEWITPVRLPVFHVKEESGGFTIIDSGGGKQTNNLRLQDKKGNEWTLRSVDKDVEKSIMPFLRNTMVETLMQDLQSALHPYAALTIPPLAEAAGVTVAGPRIFYIPDDPALGEHRSIFANTVCFLEEREPTTDNSEAKSSKTVLDNVIEKPDHRLLQAAILKARLLDILIADWDRHEDQWRWGKKDSSGITYYYPIPRDRDFAYFQSDGLFLKLASLTVLPFMRGFTKQPNQLKHLNAKVYNIDIHWLNELTAEDWEAAITLFQKQVTDSVIEIAVKKLPQEIYPLTGSKFISKLKSRRDGLMKYAMRYYRFLATHPIVRGTDGEELIWIGSDENNISITIFEHGVKDNERIIYHRKFTAKETRRITIMGLGGNDQFELDKNASSHIRIFLEGGEGQDVYHVKGNIKTKINDEQKTIDKPVLAHKFRAGK
ncbi:MAG: hypothetical protein ACXWCG_06970 [Flavitalea sp.]